MKNKSIAFAYYADNKFIGWYADSFGSIRDCPKLYSNLEKMRPIITKNISYKLKKINESSFNEAKEKVTGLGAALGLASFDSEELLRGKNVELRAVECPEYDGPNPNFDRESYQAIVAEQKAKMIEEGIYDIPASKERTDRVDEFRTRFPSPKCDNWTYCDYAKVKEWAKTEPSEFIEVIKPEL